MCFRFPPDKNPWPAYTVCEFGRWRSPFAIRHLPTFSGSFFPPSFDCPHELERIGALGDGGKWACGMSRLEHKPDCIIYTFGVAVHSFHFGSVLICICICVGMNYETTFEAELLERTRHCQVWGYDYRSNSFGSHIKNNYRAHFFSWGLANLDAHESHNNPKLYTLKTLLEINSSYAPLSPFHFY